MPYTPDPEADTIRNELLLSLVPGIGPRMRKLLIERFESPEAILDAAPSDLQTVQGIGPKLAGNIAMARDTLDPDAEIALCRDHGIEIILRSDPRYPRLLHEIEDPPCLLFVRGELLPRDAVSIAIVGSRHATSYGNKVADMLASGLARAGMTIVSGLARGIDSAAHRGTLEASGRTIAVLGSGLLELYPPENRGLATQIVSGNGAIMSESPPRTKPQGGLFPQRNRIISGMTLGTIVVEAKERSGALITARLAYEQGRDVFAVPGPIDRPSSRGCHLLLRDGATLAGSVDDVIESLGPLIEAVPSQNDSQPEIRHPAELMLNEVEKAVLAAIDSDATLIDAVINRSDLPAHQVLATISVLEMRRLVRRTSGTSVRRL